MACRTFEGQLRRKKWIGWQKSFVRLHRGVVSIYDTRADLDDDASDRAGPKKVQHFHLDQTNLMTGKNPTTLKLRLRSGEFLKFRVTKSSGTPYREEWVKIFREHIAYANRCAGIPPKLAGGVPEQGNLLAAMAKESRERMDLLQLSLVAFHVAVREMQARVNSGVTEKMQDVAGAAERAQKALKQFYDALLQENIFREEELTKQLDRAQLAEDTLEVVTGKYNALMVNTEKIQTERSMASSEYFTPSQSGRSLVLSEYFTPEGSLRGFMDAYHSDDEASLNGDNGPDQSEGLDLLLSKAQITDNIKVEQILRALYEAAKRRDRPRKASIGPMSIAGSSYNERLLLDHFDDCISMDTRSFVVSNGYAIVDEPYLDVSTTKSSHYTDARSSFASDAQSFKSALSESRVV